MSVTIVTMTTGKGVIIRTHAPEEVRIDHYDFDMGTLLHARDLALMIGHSFESDFYDLCAEYSLRATGIENKELRHEVLDNIQAVLNSLKPFDGS